MRVTQSMLSNNMLRNLNTNYGKLSKLQEMIQSGSKLTRPSDDPVVAVKGMGYRIELDRVVQYKRNITDAHSWLDSTDEALGQVGDAIKRVQELAVQASNDTNTEDDRKKMKEEIAQIRMQIRDVANTKIGDNYIFSGTHTDLSLFVNGQVNPNITTGAGKSIEINVFEGISININTPAKDLFSDIDSFMANLETLLESGATSTDISDTLGDGATTELSGLFEKVLSARSSVGARQNRIEMMENRIDLQEVNVTKRKSENEDTDYALAITQMTTAQAIHQASLSVGANIIQQTLVDFIR